MVRVIKKVKTILFQGCINKAINFMANFNGIKTKINLYTKEASIKRDSFMERES